MNLVRQLFYTKFLIICRIFLKVQLKINIDKDLVISIASDCLLQHILSPCIHDRISSHNQRGILISSHRHRLYVSRCLDISHFSTIYNYLDIFSECASALCVHIFKRLFSKTFDILPHLIHFSLHSSFKNT